MIRHGLLCFVLVALPLASARGQIWPDLSRAPRIGGGENDAALIVAVENYTSVSRVEGALANADAWRAWLDARGVPWVKMLKNKDAWHGFDAKGRPLGILQWVRKARAAVNPAGTLWFIFIGHGATTRAGRPEGMLLGFDVQKSVDNILARGIPIETQLLAELRGGRQKDTVVVLDACFSGLDRRGAELVKGLQVMLTPDEIKARENEVVLTAAKPDQYAGQLPGAERPAFSYLLLLALRGAADKDRDGGVTAGEARDFVDHWLSQLQNKLVSTPTVWPPAARGRQLGRAVEKAPDLRAISTKISTSGEFGDLLRKQALRKELERLEWEERARARRECERALSQSWEKAREVVALGGPEAADALRRFLAKEDSGCDNPHQAEAKQLLERLGDERGDTVWVRHKGGRFRMGSENGDSDEKPVHWVTVGDFELAKTEVRNAQYKKCVDAGVCAAAHWDDDTCHVPPGWNTGRLPDRFRGSNQPVVCVDWEQASAYAKWIGGRLPTEAEWEYAARSGGKDRPYPWGSAKATCKRAVMDDGGNGCGRDSTWPVCSKSPAGDTESGVCDMAGNVWEWVADWYGAYSKQAQTDPRGPTPGVYRVLRGGCWYYNARYVRAASRGWGRPSGRFANIGFRLARSSP